MRVLIAGSHGKIGQRLVRMLTESGHQVVGMIRNEAQADRIRQLGGRPLVADLESDVAFAADGVDAIVYTAGAGPGSGAAKKQTVDRGGAEKLVDAAGEHGVSRFVMVSAINVDRPEAGPQALRPYLEAKLAADEYLAAAGLDHTIVRPGSLTDEPGDGRVEAAGRLGRRGHVSRDNVAAVVAAVLEDGTTIGKTFELLDGDVSISEALRRL